MLARRAVIVLMAANAAALAWLVWTPAAAHACDATTSLIGRVFCLSPGLTLLGNIMLLVPTAVLLRTLLPQVSTLRLTMVTTALACLIETVQFFIPGRDPSLGDAFANAAGAALVLTAFATPRRSA